MERIGCGALVLAAGGFAANAAMVQHYMPEAAKARCNGHEGNQGDAIRLGAQIGGALILGANMLIQLWSQEKT